MVTQRTSFGSFRFVKPDHLWHFQMLFFCFILASFPFGHALAQSTALADDGRAVILNEDGSWSYLSEDRYATRDDGARIRLRDDGRWEVVEQPHKRAPAAARSPTSGPMVRLLGGSIQVYKDKQLKTTRYETQTVFELALEMPQNSGVIKPRMSHFNLFRVEDSRGRKYPVTSITPQRDKLKAGEKLQFTIATENSPKGVFSLGTKFVYLSIDRAVFNTATDLKFMQRIDQLETRQLAEPPR